MEKWKDIPEFEGVYRISDQGNILSCRNNRLIHGDRNSSGYSRVILSNGNIRKRFFIHRMVAMMFCGGYFDGAVVNHKNLDKSDNRASNLEWVSRSENSRHAHINGHQPGAFTKKPYEIVYRNGESAVYDSVRDCAVAYGICKSTLYNILNRGGAMPDGSMLRRFSNA